MTQAAETRVAEVPAAEAPAVDAPPVRVFGVRHHGPGSARSLARALQDYQPQVVLVEGPADADPVVSWAAAPGMKPPVALLAWDVADPRRSAFWPFAVFSPEWQAITWAARRDVPVRFIDLPSASHLPPEDVGDQEAEESQDDVADDGSQPEELEAADDALPGAEPVPVPDAPVRQDPIARLAAAAGYSDPEAWWEDVVELRMGDEEDPFDLITEAMAELREQVAETDPETLVREAHMRKQLRAATKEGFERIAVVVGAWHAPALSGKLPPASKDNALLKGLPRTKTQVTWVPWTHARLATSSGYGAGVTSPGWYHHLFTTHRQPIERWLTRVAGVLRRHDLPVSTASVIEAVRLTEALGVLRGRPMPGLDEVSEATWSVLCEGESLRLDLVTREAVVGERLGKVPDEVPTVPLDGDLRARAKRLRLAFSAEEKVITLDLRKDNDLAKSQLLHQVRLLDIPWGESRSVGTTGTFKEAWALRWQPEFAVRIVLAARHGNTVPVAAAAALLEGADTLPRVTAAVEAALEAGLDAALPPLLQRLDDLAAQEAGVIALLEAVPPLARVRRYGDVRRTDASDLTHVTDALLGRATAALPSAASGLGEEAALEMRKAVDQVHAVVPLLEEATQQLWLEALRQTADRRDVPGILAGRVVRMLLERGWMDQDEAAGRVGRVLSGGTAPDEQATWVEGFLAGDPLLVIHDQQIPGLLDEWLGSISDEAFTDVLPVLRRTFGAWPQAARRQLATRFDAGAPVQRDEEATLELDPAILRTVRLLLTGESA